MSGGGDQAADHHDRQGLGNQDYLLLSPVPDRASPVTVTAWGKQLSVNSSSDGRLAPFIKKYWQGPQAPEPGAVCTGGVQG